MQLRPARNPSAQDVGVHDRREGVVARAPGVDTPSAGSATSSRANPIDIEEQVAVRGGEHPAPDAQPRGERRARTEERRNRELDLGGSKT